MADTIKLWLFKRGEWEQVEVVDKQDYNEWLKALGLTPSRKTTIGRDYTWSIEIFWREKDESKSWTHFVCFGDGDLCEFILVQDLPSLLIFLRDFSPFVMANQSAGFIAEIEDPLRKVFHAWHGHDVDDACNDCDPRAWAEHRAAQAERRAKKNG